MVQSLTFLTFTTSDQNLWAPGAAIELGIDTGDLFIIDPAEVVKPLNVGGSFLGAKAELVFDTKFGLLAYAGIGEAGRFGGGLNIALNVEHAAIIGTDENGTILPLSFDFDDFDIISANLESQGFGLGVEAGLDFVVGVELGFRNVELAIFGIDKTFDDISIIDLPEKRIPIFTVDPLQTELPFDLGFGLELTLRVPTGANTEGFVTGSPIVTSQGVSEDPFLELSADVDELILTLLGKIPFPPLAAVVKTLENSVFATFEFDLADYIPIAEDIFTVEATVLDIGATVGANIAEDLSLDFTNGQNAIPDVNIVLRSDNGTPDDISDDHTTTAKLGDIGVTLPNPTYEGFGEVLVEATYDINRARFSHAIGIDVTGSFNIDFLKAETGGLIGSKLGINIGPLVNFEFPEGGFRASLLDDLYTNSFDVDGSAFNTVTDTYEVFYSDLVPNTVDPTKAGQVQELIAFNEERQINAAASAAAFADIIGTRPVISTFQINQNGGVPPNIVGTPEAVLWRWELTALFDSVMDIDLPEDERDVLGIDVTNVASNVPGLKNLTARVFVNGDNVIFPFEVNAASAADDLGRQLLAALPTQATITNDPDRGTIDGTYIEYKIQTGEFVLGDFGRFARFSSSVNVIGSASSDVLVYFGDEGRLFDGAGQEGFTSSGDAFIANFAVNHPFDRIEWDLRTTAQGAVGQGGDAVELKLSRGDAFNVAMGTVDDILVNFTPNGSGGLVQSNAPDGPASYTEFGLPAAPGTYIVRIFVKDEAGSNGLKVLHFNGTDLVDLGTFELNEEDETDASGVREIVIKDVQIGGPNDFLTLATDASGAGDSGTELIDIQRIEFFEQHTVSLIDIESFVLALGNKDDYIATGFFRDLIDFGGGEDTLLLTHDEFEETMNLGAGADIALIEVASFLTLETTAEVLDVVYGQEGADEAIIRNIDTTEGLRWQTFTQDPSLFLFDPDTTVTFLSEVTGFDATFTELQTLLLALDTLLQSPDFGNSTTTFGNDPDRFVQFAFNKVGDGDAVFRLADFEAISVEGSDTQNDLAVFFGGSFYEGGDGDKDTFAADFSDYNVIPIGGRGIVINGFHDGGDPTAVSEFTTAPTRFAYDAGLTFANGERERVSLIDGFERLIVTGTEFDDLLVGGQWDDSLNGAGGNDVLVGGGSANVGPGNTGFTNRLDGGAGNDTFFVDAGEFNNVDGGDDNDLLIYRPGGFADDPNLSTNGIFQILNLDGGGANLFFSQTSASGLLLALDILGGAAGAPVLFNRELSISPVQGITEFSNIERTNIIGLDQGDDLLIFDGGASYIGGENIPDTDVDTFAADFSDQSFGITFVLDEAVDGTNLGNGVFVSGIDRIVLRLGSGQDFVTGGTFDDFIDGGDGADILRGGGALTADTINGGQGSDLIAWNASDGVAIVDGGTDAGDTEGAVTDRLLVSNVDDAGAALVAAGFEVEQFDNAGISLGRVGAASSTSQLEGALFDLNDAVTTQIIAGTSRVEYTNIEATEIQGSNEHDDLIIFGNGTFYDGGERDGDRDIFAAELSGETRDLQLIARTGDDRISDDLTFQDIGNGTTIGNFEQFILRLGAGDDSVIGGEFDDVIRSGGGDDILSGGQGDDILDGQSGDDIIFYDGGIDIVRGGDDFDVLELGALEGGYRSIASAVNENLASINGFVERAALGGIEKMQDQLGQLLENLDTGASSFIRIQGQGGVSSVTGEFLGTDEVSFFSTDVEVLVISADDEDDILISGAEGGTLSGDGGSDILIGRSGDDVLIGGGDEDFYIFKDNWGSDIIGGEIAGAGSLVFLGTNRADVTFSAFDDNLAIDNIVNGASVVFLDYFASGTNGLNYTFGFDDQISTLDLSTLDFINVTGAIAPGITVFGSDASDDLLDGTAGADSYFARNGNDLIRSSAGPDIISGGLGRDVVVYENSPLTPGGDGVVVDLGFGFGTGGFAEGDILISIEDVLGTAGHDQIFGDGKRNAIAGGQGDDVIGGGGGDDFLSGDSGNDTIAGEDGEDLIFGGGGDDSIFGDAGADYITAGAGNDTIEAGAGNDTVLGGDDDDTVLLEDGDDIYLISSTEPSLNGDIGNDTIDGGAGNDRIDLTDFDAEVTIFLGGPFGGAQFVATSGANDTTPPGTFRTIASLTDFENAVGGRLDDVLIGGTGANSLAGNSGDDLLVGNAGNDLLIGGAGFDRVDYASEGGGGSVLVNLLTGVVTDSFGNSDTLVEIEHIFGGNVYSTPGAAFDDLIGDDGDNRFTGNKGVDVDFIDGNGGIDTVDYGSESDTQNYLPGTLTPGSTGVGVVVDLSVIGSFASPNATDTSGHGDLLEDIENVIGSIRDDSITGSDLANTIIGGDGNDTLDGGAGIDTLDYSQDQFAPAGGIVINDLDPSQNRDRFGDVDVLSGFEVIIATEFADQLTRDTALSQVLFAGDGDDVVALVGTPTGLDAQSVYGGAGNDIIGGSTGADLIFGGTGNDTVGGNGGDDVYVYTSGLDGYFGVAGTASGIEEANFSIFGAAVQVDLSTQSYQTNDTQDATGPGTLRTLMQSSGIDAVMGSAFNDLILDDVTNNRLSGNAGDDTIFDGMGSDVIDGGAGFDTLHFVEGTGGIAFNLGNAGQNLIDSFGFVERVTGIERFIGTAQNDSFIGGDGNETFVGGDGVDSYHGGDGFDTIDLSLETGANPTSVFFNFDVITGESFGTLVDSFGNSENFRSIERIIGGDGGFDDLFGGGGNEIFTGNAGASVDQMFGNGGIDTVDYSLENGVNGVIADISVDGSLGTPNATDTFGDPDALSGIENLIGSRNNDVFTGSALANTLLGNAGNDVFAGGDGADLIDGGLGLDTVNYSLEVGAGAITVDLRRRGGQVEDTFGSFDTLVSIEQLHGSIFADTIIGDDRANTLLGTHGDDFIDGWAGDDVLFGETDHDTLLGFEGDDTLFGGLGNDTLRGEQEDDVLVGGQGSDTVDGGAGDDTASYEGSSAAVIVAVNGAFAIGGDAQGDTLTDIENLLGSAFADFLRGDGQANVLTGGAGADYIQGRGGDDTLNGGENDDLLEPGAGADTVDGGAGQDLLSALDAAGPVTINLGNVALSSAGYADKTLISIEGVLGVAGFGNTLVGGGGEDLLIGGDVADSIAGAGGADILLGLGGADTISGGAGDDLILGLEGDDVLTGDAGRDLFLFEPGDGADVVTDFELPVGGSGFEDRLFFSGLGLTFADLDIAEVGGDVVIGYGTNPAAFDGSVTVEGVTLAELVPGGAQPDWILVF